MGMHANGAVHPGVCLDHSQRRLAGLDIGSAIDDIFDPRVMTGFQHRVPVRELRIVIMCVGLKDSHVSISFMLT